MNTSINLMPLFFKGRECKSSAVSPAHCHCSSCRMPAGWPLWRKQLTSNFTFEENLKALPIPRLSADSLETGTSPFDALETKWIMETLPW